jgi:glucose dehydrogenase
MSRADSVAQRQVYPGKPSPWPAAGASGGGGSTWITGVYDPGSNTTYWGTGNPGPWVGDDRPGDNLYTDSTLALDADTGKLKSYHQYTPHDSWDWDEVSAPLLIDTEVDGKLTKTATHAGRNGYLWILDRDRLKFLHAFPFANNNVFTGTVLVRATPVRVGHTSTFANERTFETKVSGPEPACQTFPILAFPAFLLPSPCSPARERPFNRMQNQEFLAINGSALPAFCEILPANR